MPWRSRWQNAEFAGSDSEATNKHVDQALRGAPFAWVRSLTPAEELGTFLVGKDGRRWEGTIPPGQMQRERVDRLESQMRTQLPGWYADVVEASQDTYAQLIYTADVPAYASRRCCLVGDAGIVAQPFTGSVQRVTQPEFTAWWQGGRIDARGLPMDRRLARASHRPVLGIPSALAWDLASGHHRIGNPTAFTAVRSN